MRSDVALWTRDSNHSLELRIGTLSRAEAMELRPLPAVGGPLRDHRTEKASSLEASVPVIVFLNRPSFEAGNIQSIIVIVARRIPASNGFAH